MIDDCQTWSESRILDEWIRPRLSFMTPLSDDLSCRLLSKLLAFSLFAISKSVSIKNPRQCQYDFSQLRSL